MKSYKNTKDKSEQFSTTELTYTIDLVTDFNVTYSTKCYGMLWTLTFFFFFYLFFLILYFFSFEFLFLFLFSDNEEACDIAVT